MHCTGTRRVAYSIVKAVMCPREGHITSTRFGKLVKGADRGGGGGRRDDVDPERPPAWWPLLSSTRTQSQWLAMLSGGGALCKIEGPFGSIGGLTEATEESRGGEFALMTLPLRASWTDTNLC